MENEEEKLQRLLTDLLITKDAYLKLRMDREILTQQNEAYKKEIERLRAKYETGKENKNSKPGAKR